MMVLNRNGMSSIKKVLLNESMYKSYKVEQLKEAKLLLRNAITSCSLSTFGMITLLRKYYTGNCSKDIYSIPKEEFLNLKFNCYYQSKSLLENLKEIGMDSYIMTYQANKYSTKFGDELIKEAHMSTIVPVLNGNIKNIVIYDPGLKIDEPIILYDTDKIKLQASGKSDIIIEKDDYSNSYPYYVRMNGINKYSYNSKPHEIFQRFNPLQYTLNPNDIIFPYSFLVLSGYKATTFSLDENKRSSISLSQLAGEFKIYDEQKKVNIILSYDNISKMKREDFKNLIADVCFKLELDIDEMIENIYFMIDIKDDFISMMNKNVLDEIPAEKRLLKRSR